MSDTVPSDLWEWIRALGGSDQAEPTLSWGSAWRMAQRTCQMTSPRRHLMRYLSSCAHRRIVPSAVTWVRFLVDDEQKEHREIAIEIAMRRTEEENEDRRRAVESDELRQWRREWAE